MIPDDASLVARAQRGDREAYSDLIVRYQVPVYNLALRFARDREDAADVTQETFLRGWEKLQTLRSAPFRAWLFRIAVNLCHDLHRRRRRIGEMPAYEPDRENVIGLGRPAPDPAQHAEAVERATLVRGAIEALEPELRTALLLRDSVGLAYDEIAVAMRVPLGTVKSRIARARAQVQERLLLFPEVFGNRRSAADEA